MSFWSAVKLAWENRALIVQILRLLQRGIKFIEIQGKLNEIERVVDEAEKQKNPQLIDDWFSGKRRD
jgi:hypothetical protein